MSLIYFNRLRKFIFLFDIIILNLVILLAHYFIFGNEQPNQASRIFGIVANVSWITIALLNNNYKILQPLNLDTIVDKFIMTIVYQALLLFGFIYFFKILNISRGFVIITFFAFAIAIIIQRIVLAWFLKGHKMKAYLAKNVVVWGNKTIADSLLSFFHENPTLGYGNCKFVDGGASTTLTRQIDVNDAKPDEIFVCYKEMSIGLLDQFIHFCEEHAIKLHVVFDSVTKRKKKDLRYDTIPILHIDKPSDMSRKVRVLKRSFDISFSVLIMTIGAPLFLIIYLITKLSSHGGAFYKQERIGKNEQPFVMYKFRSMYVNSEKHGPQLSKDDDPRITKFGKFIRKTRLDELPQFWNVLKGEMSVVGYRPERKHFIEEIARHTPEYKKMLDHKPGLTSLGQVHYGYAESVDQMLERLKYDLLYFRNMTLDSDLNIIMRTVKVMVQAKGK